VLIMAKKWTAEEDATLERVFPYCSDVKSILEVIPKRSLRAVYERAQTLKLQRKVWRGMWTSEELAILKKEYRSKPILEMQKLLPKRTKWCIWAKASELRLTKNLGNIITLEIIGQLSNFEAGYIACALDSEGHITLIKRRGSYSPEVGIDNTNLKFVEWIQRRVGGLKTVHTRQGKTWKTSFRLLFTGIRRTLPLLRLFEPHLIVKRRQAQLVISFCESRLNRPLIAKPAENEVEIVREVRHLNKRG